MHTPLPLRARPRCRRGRRRPDHPPLTPRMTLTGPARSGVDRSLVPWTVAMTARPSLAIAAAVTALTVAGCTEFTDPGPCADGETSECLHEVEMDSYYADLIP